nr:photosystem I subunit VIII [Corydalis bungeana]UVH70427.1 photosystem I subunit VIII [Corydalis bungeana]
MTTFNLPSLFVPLVSLVVTAIASLSSIHLQKSPSIRWKQISSTSFTTCI